MAAAVTMAAASVSAKTTTSSYTRSEFSGLRLPQQQRNGGIGSLDAKAAFLPAQKQQLRRKTPTQALYIKVTPGFGPLFRPYGGGFGPSPFGYGNFRYSPGPFGPSPFGYGNPFSYGYGYRQPRRGGGGLLTLAPFLLYLASVAAPHFARWMQSQQKKYAESEGANKEGESTPSAAASTSYTDEEEAAWERRFAAGVRTESTDTGAAYRFRVELPGYERGDIKVQVMENVLIVTAAKQGEGARAVGKVERKFRLAKNVDAARTSAACENGVLVVTVPKTKESQAVEVDIQ
eukprot:jgi/Chlat1/5303/Chrsp35S05250